MSVVRQACESATAETRFNGARLFATLQPLLRDHGKSGPLYREVERTLGPLARRTLPGLMRMAFLIEPVNEAVTSTKFAVRWGQRLQGDPRWASFATCEAIFEGLLADARIAVEGSDEYRILAAMTTNPIIAYEIPADYAERLSEGIHDPDNAQWIWADTAVEATALLRQAIGDNELLGQTARVLRRAVDKITVKTYLTDRAQTGLTQTNREKRWEAHPDSVQFALRADCIKVEHELIEQIAYFDGFPEAVREALVARGVIARRLQVSRCPITLDPHSYAAFAAELEHPEHGRAQFQVGHLNPLKGPGAGPGFGHTRENIAWISADGNRIQGHLSLDQTRELLRRIATTYEELGEV